MAYDAFLKLDTIKGEATAKGMEGAINLQSFSWGAHNTVNASAGMGMGAGKVTLSSFNFMKKTDASSPPLFLACCAGTHFPKGSVTLRKAGGEQSDYLTYEFERCMVESVNWSGSSGGDDTPAESVSLAFQKVTITYKSQDDKGKLGNPIKTGWDVSKNVKV